MAACQGPMLCPAEDYLDASRQKHKTLPKTSEIAEAILREMQRVAMRLPAGGR